MQTLSVGECLSFGWNAFKARPWFFVQAGLLLFLVNMGVSLLQSLLELGAEQTGAIIVTLVGIVSTAIGMAVSFLTGMGQTNLFLRAHDNVETANIGDLWHPKPFWKFTGASLLSGLLILIGFILVIVPGIFLAILFMFVGYLVIEEGLGPVEALKRSALITKGNRWKLLGLGLAIVGINILGLLAIILGLFVSIPVSFLAVTHAYRVLHKGAVVETGALEPALA